MIGQGVTNVTFFEFKKEDNEYEITWSKNEPKFAELNLGSVLRLQPFQDKLVEDESRTLLHCKGALGHNTSNLKVLYTLSTKPEKYVDSTEPYFRNITIAHTIGALKSDITKPREDFARKVLRSYLNSAQLTGTTESGLPAPVRGLVFRVDTYVGNGGTLLLNEIELWPLGMDFLDQLREHSAHFKELGEHLAEYVQSRYYSWPL